MKHIFLSLGLMTTIACNDAGPESKNRANDTIVVLPYKGPALPMDTIRTTVTIATQTRDFQAKVFYEPKMIDTFEPANNDSTLWRPIRKKVFNKITLVHVIDTVIEKNKPPRPIDTFVQVLPEFVIKDLGRLWVDTSAKKVDTIKKK